MYIFIYTYTYIYIDIHIHRHTHIYIYDIDIRYESPPCLQASSPIGVASSCGDRLGPLFTGLASTGITEITGLKRLASRPKCMISMASYGLNQIYIYGDIYITMVLYI